jgi:hypothetical protein
VRKEFPGHYPLSDLEFRRLWSECIFVFDTNVLLNLFKFSPKTREYFLSILDNVSERIWIPHQVGFEYHKHREDRIIEQVDLYDFEKFSKKFMEFKASLEGYKHHPVIDFSKLTGILTAAVDLPPKNGNT